MTLPTLVFDLDYGDDTYASGAGPEVAINGTQGRTHSYYTTHIGFYDSPTPDLSGVATDGSAVVRMFLPSGRTFASISAVKDSTQSTTGDMNLGGNSVLNVPAISGMSTFDHIRIAGAGVAGVDLYTAITGFSGSGPYTITVADAASTAVTGAAVTCPKGLTSNQAFSHTGSDRWWSIGGHLATPDGSRALFLDLLPGWTAHFLAPASGQSYGSGYDETVLLSASGDTATGPIWITAEPGARLKAGISGKAMEITGSMIFFVDLGLDQASSGFEVSGSASDLYFFRIRSSGPSYSWKFLASATGSRFLLSSCDVRDGFGIDVAAGATIHHIRAEASLFSGTAMVGIALGALVELEVVDSIFKCGNTGISMIGGPSIGIERTVFDSCGRGIHGTGSTANYKGIRIRNNSFSNGSGTALDFTGIDIDKVKGVVDFNNFWSNAANRAGVSAGANDITTDPQFWDSGALDYRAGLNLRGVGFPSTMGVGIFPMTTDIGVRRQEPAGGGIIARIQSIQDLGDDWEIGVTFTGGNEDGKGQLLRIPKALIPDAGEPNREGIIQAGLSYLRDHAGSEDGFASREVLI